jgi:hypothetical protein
MDSGDICAEHLKHLPSNAVVIITNIFNRILHEGKVPRNLKDAYKLMIPKPTKDARVMDNYRGITITSILLKVLESICMEKQLKKVVDSSLSDLQVGFTNNRSPALASLLITETAAESKHKKIPLYVASLDAK